MREINNYQERLAQVHALESARNILQIANSLFDGLVGNSRSLRGSNRRQNIVDVDASDQRRRDLQLAVWCLRGKPETGERQLKFFGGDVRRIFDSVGDRLFRQTSQPFPRRIVVLE